MTSFYRKIYKIFQPLVMKAYKINVIGAENIPEDGAIIAANHTAVPDVVVISAAMKRQVRYMAKKELFFPPLAQLIRALGAFPVDRGGADVKSIKTMMSLIAEGELVGIFPQGHRYPGVDPRTTEIKAGVGFIAYHTGAKVIPTYIDTSARHTRLFHRTTVIFGSPIETSELGFTKGGKDEYMAASKYIFDKICENAFPGGSDNKDGDTK